MSNSSSQSSWGSPRRSPVAPARAGAGEGIRAACASNWDEPEPAVGEAGDALASPLSSQVAPRALTYVPGNCPPRAPVSRCRLNIAVKRLAVPCKPSDPRVWPRAGQGLARSPRKGRRRTREGAADSGFEKRTKPARNSVRITLFGAAPPE